MVCTGYYWPDAAKLDLALLAGAAPALAVTEWVAVVR